MNGATAKSRFGNPRQGKCAVKLTRLRAAIPRCSSVGESLVV